MSHAADSHVLLMECILDAVSKFTTVASSQQRQAWDKPTTKNVVSSCVCCTSDHHGYTRIYVLSETVNSFMTIYLQTIWRLTGAEWHCVAQDVLLQFVRSIESFKSLSEHLMAWQLPVTAQTSTHIQLQLMPGTTSQLIDHERGLRRDRSIQLRYQG